MHDTKHHIAFRKDIGYIEVVGMGAAVDDPIHVQIQVVKLWKQRLIGNDLINLWIALTEPAVKLYIAGIEVRKSIGGQRNKLGSTTPSI